jgi:hypothetical protein
MLQVTSLTQGKLAIHEQVKDSRVFGLWQPVQAQLVANIHLHLLTYAEISKRQMIH